MEQPYLKSKFKITYRILSFVIVLILYGFCIELLSKYKVENPITLSFLISGIALLVLSCYLLFQLLTVFSVTFYSNRIELIQAFGLRRKTISLTQIDSWIIRKKKSKYGDYEILYLVLSDQSVLKFSSYLYTNFHLISSKLKNNKAQNSFLRNQWNQKEQKWFTFFCIAIGFLFLGIALNSFQDEQITRVEISTLNGHLLENIEVKKSRRSRSFVLKLEEYPDYEFKIGSLILRETASGNLMNDFQKGDQIKFAIERKEYEKKILKTSALSSWDYIFHYHSISIIEIAEVDFVYLSLENYNKAINSNNVGITLFFGAFGVMFLAFSFVRLRKKAVKSSRSKKRFRKL